MPTNTTPSYPICGMDNTYLDGENFICPDCSHEWSSKIKTEEIEEKRTHKDAHGNVLNNGNTITLIKDLKVKGSSLVIKSGTKIKNIRLAEGDHDIDCKIDVIAFYSNLNL